LKQERSDPWIINKKVETNNFLNIVPDKYSFITVRREKSGGFLFNPYLFNEVPLNETEIRILELCNGFLLVKDIINTISDEFFLSGKDAETLTINALNNFSKHFAINCKQEKRAGEFKIKKNVSKGKCKGQDRTHGIYHYSAPLSVIFEITHRCNLGCKHCLVDAGKPLENELSLKEIKKIIDQLVEMKVFNVNFGGGEPFLRDDFFDILEYASKSNIGIVFSTNGFLVNDEVLDKLENIKTFAVQISVDGLEKTHDEFRGVKGSFKRAVWALKKFSDKGYYTIMSTMMLKKNIGELEFLIKLCLSMGISSFKLSTFMPAGRGNKNINDFLLTPSDLKSIAVRMLKQKKEYIEKINMDINGTFPWLIENKPKKLLEGFKERYERIGCSAGMSSLTISPNGDVYPCPFLRNYPAGNLCSDKLKDIWENSDVFDVFRNIDRTKLKGKCGTCGYMPYYCQGGCRAAAFLQTGDFYAEDPNCWYGCNLP